MKGERPDPTPTPAKIQPLATPRSCEGIQRETNWFEAGYMIASPMPSRKRTPINAANGETMDVGIAAVSAVKTPHHSTEVVRTRRGPKRSASQPAGV